jgi:NAD(P)-dependent dehydrogenase (short-subunit alcohol dehydrogenase family)
MIDSLFSLKGKVIVITGAVGLLGKMHSEVIAKFGGTTVLIDLNKDLVEKESNLLQKKYNVPSLGLPVNITIESQVKLSTKKILDTFGRIDGLVNNAANNPKVEVTDLTNFSRLENFPIDIWYQDISVGLTGAFLCSKYYGSEIAKNPDGGSIVNISSDLGLIAPDQRLYAKKGLPDELQAVKPVTYSVVKTGLIGLTRYLATYWAEKNVRCNAICPGGVENGQSEDFLSMVSSKIPLNRLANETEYQGTIVWMLSDSSSYLNGAIIPVDGGRTAW